MPVNTVGHSRTHTRKHTARSRTEVGTSDILNEIDARPYGGNIHMPTILLLFLALKTIELLNKLQVVLASICRLERISRWQVCFNRMLQCHQQMKTVEKFIGFRFVISKAKSISAAA